MPGQDEGKYDARDMDWLRFFNGGVAGMASKTAIAPLERIKYIFVVD